MNADPEQALFEACLAAASTQEREGLLARSGNRALADKVRRLLQLHDAAPDSVSAPGFAEWPHLPQPDRVGAFRVLERIGEGAMGEVYLAEQLQPVHRRVALKILKFGLGSREVLARFETERRTLALMTHPNIARILEAGTTDDGRPYFAMEYVPGVALTRFCDEHRLDVDARLALFQDVCAGVQHAHLRGVIHRDIKPSNILVAEVDGVAVPKIIDFGIAKATASTLDTGDAHTRLGNLLGTPEYMSPEQAQLSPLDVDARTDVYSLGVVLYELLTGTRPYSIRRDTLDPASVARDIIEGDPVRPSERALQAGEDAAERALRRDSTPGALRARLRGDLDWITIKALEKDRQRRYLSAADLAADLTRSALHEPVVAGPPSAMYRISKFARRHRLAVAAGVTLFAAAIGFGSGMALLAQRAAAERDRANEEAEIARRVTAFTADLFEMANPANIGSSSITARELLDAGVRRLDSESSVERSDVRAALFEAAGNAYRGLGDYPKAAPLLGRASNLRAERRQAEPRAYAQALHSQAQLARAQGEFARAETLLRESVALQARGNATQSSVPWRANLGLAAVLRLQSKLDDASSLARRTIEACSRRDPPDVECIAHGRLQLGRNLAALGQLTEAERELARSLALHRQFLGERSEATLEAKDGLADVLVILGKSSLAEPLLREIVDARRQIYGDSHPGVGVALSNLGNAVSDFAERLPEAEGIYLEAITALRTGAGSDHPELATALNNLGFVYNRMQRWEQGRAAYSESAAIRRETIGADHPDTAAAQLGEALALNKLNQFTQAERLLRTAISTFRSRLGGDHWRTANAETYLGIVLTNLGRYDEAETTLRTAERKLQTALGNEHARTATARKAIDELIAARDAAARARS